MAGWCSVGVVAGCLVLLSYSDVANAAPQAEALKPLPSRIDTPTDANVDPAAAGPRARAADAAFVPERDPIGERPIDTYEYPNKTYYFLGARYRLSVMPAFVLNWFMRHAPTITSNTAGIELNIRRNGFNVVPALSFSEYGIHNVFIGDVSGDLNEARNWSRVHSTIKGVFATVDLLWSTPVARHVDIEYGLGVGAGFTFGNLNMDWVYRNGDTLTPCQTVEDGPAEGLDAGCRSLNHQATSKPHVGGYVVPDWMRRGSLPNAMLWLTPQFGVRLKPIKHLEAHLTTGVSLTGIWVGLSVNYGFEQIPKLEK